MKKQAKCLSPQGGDRSGDRGGDVPEVRTIIYPDPCAAAGCAKRIPWIRVGTTGARIGGSGKRPRIRHVVGIAPPIPARLFSNESHLATKS